MILREHIIWINELAYNLSLLSLLLFLSHIFFIVVSSYLCVSLLEDSAVLKMEPKNHPGDWEVKLLPTIPSKLGIYL